MAKNKTAQPSSDTDIAPEHGTESKATINAVETKLMLSKKIISSVREQLNQLERLLSSEADASSIDDLVTKQVTSTGEFLGPQSGGRIVEGVFDGQNMVGSDGHQYLVPQNYASKSKLVEGDILKLTIQPSGGFLFKQIGPIERERIVGMLVRDENTQSWKVVADGKKYSVLPASVSYFKGQPGDDAVVLIPRSAPSRWAAIENVIKKE
ncbi:hypothetical protein HY479_02645 [Candidatus Uhrbacteria bacterium]|nr:hypothetical protein [Candidatus Uhrbacteria bacterium]